MRLLDPSGRMQFVVSGIDARHGFSEAARFGAAVAAAAEQLGRRIAVVGIGTLSPGPHPPVMATHGDSVASAADDALNRVILGALIHGDTGPLAADPAGAGPLDLAFIGVAVGALGSGWRGGDVLAYGATWGAGAAVVELRTDRRP